MYRVIQRLCAVLLLGFGTVAFAQQAYPSRPIRLVVPYAAGGSTDIMARALQIPMSEYLGQPVVVDNKPGAAGAIGMRDVANAPPDGYTIVFMNNGLVATTPVLQKDAGYDGIKSFEPIGMVSSSPMLVTVAGALPVQDLESFICYVKNNPGKLEYASAGPGSFGHLSTELFLRSADLQMVHIPYKGQAPTLQALLTGEVKLLITSPSAMMNNYIASKKIKLLAVGTAEISPLYPGVPLVSSVIHGYEAESWFALLAPAQAPRDVVIKINTALNKALMLPEIRERMKTFGMVEVSSTPEELRKRIATEVARWGTVIQNAGIKLE